MLQSRCHRSGFAHDSEDPAHCRGWGWHARGADVAKARCELVEQAEAGITDRVREPPFERSRVRRPAKLHDKPGETAGRASAGRADRQDGDTATRHGDSDQRLKSRAAASHGLKHPRSSQQDAHDTGRCPRHPGGIPAHVRERRRGQAAARRGRQPAN